MSKRLSETWEDDFTEWGNEGHYMSDPRGLTKAIVHLEQNRDAWELFARTLTGMIPASAIDALFQLFPNVKPPDYGS